MSILFLIGMPGAGKSYWGKELATAHQLPFIDLDGFIEMQEEMSIKDIFDTRGEKTFREIERAALISIIYQLTFPAIIACGGGTPMFYDNMQVMRVVGCVVYLKTPLPILIERLQIAFQTRPLLNGPDPLQELLEQLYASRHEVYEQAQHILPTENISLTTFDQIISSCINRP
ncbi:MAG: shikimate kinase [Bacteroidota bacterium]